MSVNTQPNTCIVACPLFLFRMRYSPRSGKPLLISQSESSTNHVGQYSTEHQHSGVSSLFLDSVIRLEREATLNFTIKNHTKPKVQSLSTDSGAVRANIFIPIAMSTPQREAYPLSVSNTVDNLPLCDSFRIPFRHSPLSV